MLRLQRSISLNEAVEPAAIKHFHYWSCILNNELLYDYGFAKNQYNGNIGGIRWKSNGDDEQRAYGFDYDNVNRLLKADFNQYTSSAWNTTAGIDFSLSNMSYDANGNILTMNQKGLKLNVSPCSS